MVLVLSNHQLLAMQSHAERVYPEECCGLILGTLNNSEKTPVKTVAEIAVLDNKWTPEISEVNRPEHITKQRRYWIDPADMLRVQKQAREKGLNIIGIYHSHPDKEAVPSECDRAQAWPDYAYIIISACGQPQDLEVDSEASRKENNAKAVDIKNWALDSDHQFQPEAMKVIPSAARERMPVSA